MADDVTLDAMSGGSVVATDEISSKHYQRIKLVHGADGVNAGDVSTSNGFPVQVISVAAGDNNIGNVDIASSVLPTGAATETTLSALNTKVTAVNTGAVVIASSALPSGAATESTLLAVGSLLASGIGVTFTNTSINIADGGNTITVDGTVAATQSGTWNVATVTAVTGITNVVHVDDNAGSLTVDAPVTTPVFVRLSDGSSAISTLPVSLASVPSHAVTNAGTFAVQVSAAIPTGSNVIGAVTQSGTWNVETVTTVSAVTAITNALPAGTNAIGKLAANSGVDIGDVDVTSISAGSNLIGDVGIQGRTTGGLTYYKNLDVDETEDDVKTSAGTLYWLHAINLSSGKRYLKIYDSTAASVIVGTTVPVLTLPLPTQGDTNGAGFTFNIPQGIAFSTGICVAATTGFADNDTGAPGANEVIINLAYK